MKRRCRRHVHPQQPYAIPATLLVLTREIVKVSASGTAGEASGPPGRLLGGGGARASVGRRPLPPAACTPGALPIGLALLPHVCILAGTRVPSKGPGRAGAPLAPTRPPPHRWKPALLSVLSRQIGRSERRLPCSRRKSEPRRVGTPPCRLRPLLLALPANPTHPAVRTPIRRPMERQSFPQALTAGGDRGQRAGAAGMRSLLPPGRLLPSAAPQSCHP